ncbi:hypothetical protein [Streptomyces sp. NPDC017230]|uniref:hypothetical protein n=1 Tax=unclassified Streptomyces TaxID=2593676 RepID=UPI0037ABA8D9
MRLRRCLAVAAAVAVTTPVALFTAAPALAAAPSAAQTQNQQKKPDQPTYAELEKTAADAKKAYEDAVVAEEKGEKELEATLDALDSDTHPLRAATITADKAAKDAADARTAAEQTVTDAEAKLEAAGNAVDRAEAQKALEAAEAGLTEAVKAKQEADTAAEKAQTALDDARVAAVREYSVLQNTLDKARKAKEAADEALATAKECVRENGLTSLAVGLPSKVVAGTTVDFTLRLTNGTERTLSVDPLVFVHVDGEGPGEKSRLKVEWSNGSGWQALNGNEPEHIGPVGTMKPGGHSDVKLRMKADSVARSTEVIALFAADASSAYRPCVQGPMKRYDFALLPAGSEPGEVDDAKPAEPDADDDKRPGTAAPATGEDSSAQGGASEQAAKAQATGTGGETEAEAEADGNLARTGSSSAMAPIALASAAAVALGAGTVFAIRRRRRAADNA